jgi:hypothetical protein
MAMHLQNTINNNIFKGLQFLLASLLKMWPGLLPISKSIIRIIVALHKSKVSFTIFVIT